VLSLSFQGRFFIIEQWLDTPVNAVRISTTTRFPIGDLLMPPLLVDA
jgi:hypothetical protein